MSKKKAPISSSLAQKIRERLAAKLKSFDYPAAVNDRSGCLANRFDTNVAAFPFGFLIRGIAQYQALEAQAYGIDISRARTRHHIAALEQVLQDIDKELEAYGYPASKTPPKPREFFLDTLND